MKFILKGPFKENVYSLIRGAGYHFQGKNESNSELDFTKPPRGYPRFHIYLKIDGENLVFNLHLDQKKPVYKGTAAHSGEYDSELIEEEAERIKKTIM